MLTDQRHKRAAPLLVPMARRRPRARQNAIARPLIRHKELEVILMRQLADCLAMPIFIVDADGTLVFYNEPAEKLLGRRFEETGELSMAEWSTAFVPTDDRGKALPPETVPLVIAVRERRPIHMPLRIRGLDRVVRRIQVTAFPLTGRAERFLGAVAIFWEAPKTE